MSSKSAVWLVTGCSSGLGLALVKAILASNQRVVATARNPNNDVFSELKSQYSDTQLLLTTLDVTKESDISAAFDLAKQKFKRVDFVVNNAGYAVLSEIEFLPDDLARKNFEVQFWGPLHIMQHAVKFFREENQGRGGRILNISTIGGYMGVPSIGIYNASKFALEGLTAAFAKEMPPAWNIKAIIIQPGGFASEYAGTSMVTVPQNPVYSESAAACQMREMLKPDKHRVASGDVDKIAKGIMRIAGEPNPPLRIQFGSDSWAMITDQAQKTLRDAEQWSDLSHSVNVDGIDGPAHAKNLIERMAKAGRA